MTQKIKAKKILSESIFFVFKNRMVLFKALCIPFVLYAALNFVDLTDQPMWATVILTTSILVMQTWFAVTTHRVVLLGQGSVPTWGLNKITRREVLFLLHAFVFFGALALLIYVMNSTIRLILPFVFSLYGPENFPENVYFIQIPIVIITAIFLCVALVATIRLTLVFPAIAIGQGVSFPLSWKLSKHHKFPLLITLFVFPVILSTPELLMGTFTGSTVVVSLLDMLINVFVVAALSISYREICQIEYGAKPATEIDTHG